MAPTTYVRDQRYDELIDAYVTTATKLFPNAMLHWRRLRGRAGRRQPDARTAGGHPRRWHGRDRYRGHDPTSKAEALPGDVIRWTEGRALVATASPFDPVVYAGRTYRIAQANNALIFPGLGLGVTVAKARRISDPMLEAAADAVAELSDPMTLGAALLPPVENLRMAPPPSALPSRSRPTREA
jgi:malic enzyme